MSRIQLLPCPFCGGREPFVCTSRYGDTKELHYHVHCGKCGCLGGHSTSECQAIELWNIRNPMNLIVEQLEYQKNVWEDESFKDRRLANEKIKAYNMALKIIEACYAGNSDN